MLTPVERDRYLAPTYYLDADAPGIIQFAQAAPQPAPDIDKAIHLYLAVRDGVRYSPYGIELKPERFRASVVLEAGVGFCVQKSVLLAAAALAVGIPSRLGFVDVRNHLATEQLLAQLKTDVFVYHSYTELFLEGRWVKATPAFNRSLCQRFGVAPLAFDGRNDSAFHAFDGDGNLFMEYLNDHGQFADLPFDAMVAAFAQAYPQLFERGWASGDFEQEAAAAN